MKKAILSLSTMVLAGAVLASCSFSTGVKVSKPKDKGKAVDEVKLVDSHGSEVTIKKDSDFQDLFSFLGDEYYMTFTATEDASKFAFAKNSKYKTETKYTNYMVTPLTVADNYKQTDEHNESKEVYGYSYAKDGKTEYESYCYSKVASKQVTVADNTSETRSYNETEKYAGSYKIDSDGTRSVDFAKSEEYSDTVERKNSTSSSSSNDYEKNNYYLNASEKPTDEHYGDYFVGVDKNGQDVSYRIGSFFQNPSLESLNTSQMYLDSYKDLYDVNFELTDKYIIVKSSTTFMYNIAEFFVYSYNRDHDGAYPSGDEAIAEYKKYFDEHVKNYKYEVEVWISYASTLPGEDYNCITIDYYKYNAKYELNDSFVYNDAYFERNGAIDEVKTKLNGKTSKIYEKYEASKECAANTDDYSKKISSTKDSIKKNNDFDGVDFKPASYA